MESFYEELNLFKGRIRKKAQERIDRAMKEADEVITRTTFSQETLLPEKCCYAKKTPKNKIPFTNVVT